MNFSVIDAGGLLLSVFACGIVLVAPGYALARVFGFARDGSAIESGGPDLLTGVVVGLAVLPALDSVIARAVGLDAALAVTLVLTLVAAVLAWQAVPVWREGSIRRPSRTALVFLGCWLVLLTIEWIDFDIGGKIYQPLTVFDTVKHASTTQAIIETGVPPRDAFFFRPERASYYYFFYTLAALAVRVCGGLADAKAAVGGMVFWVGVGAYGLVRLALARTGLDRVVSVSRRPLIIVAVLAAGGLDILAALFYAWRDGVWIADPLKWNEQVGAWLQDVLWVPHHVTALLAGTVGLIALCDAMDAPRGPVMDARRGPAVTWRVVVLAGLAFAASFGLSVWVTFGFVVTVISWGACLAVERRWRPLGLVLLAGLAALLVAAPQLLDLKAGRAGGGAIPIAFGLRSFTPVDVYAPDGPMRFVAAAFGLPINYAFEFGLLALGSVIYWRQSRTKGIEGGEFARVLTIAAIVGLVLGGILRSTMFGNDLGWRVVLLPLLAGTVWTIAATDGLIEAYMNASRRTWTLTRPLFCGLLVLGWMTVAYTAVLMRAFPFLLINPSLRFIAKDPETMRSMRAAYGWTTRNLPASAVIQENPTFQRAFAFGVYGRNPIGVADLFGSLYGADPGAVAARLDAVGPIFNAALSSAAVRERAAANRIDALIVTVDDPIWSRSDSFVWHQEPVFASDRVRIFAMKTLSAMR